MRRALWLACAWTVVGCYASVPPADSGSGDARASDVGAADTTSVDAASVDAATADAPLNDAGPPAACGTSTCGPSEICIRGRCAGCCDLPPECIPIPAGCTGTLGCGCFTADPCGGCTTCQAVTSDGIMCGNCLCACAAPWTPIATPSGPRPIVELRVGDLVYTVDHGQVVVAPIVRVNRRDVTRHAIVRVTLASGAVVEMSGAHPTADGRRFDSLVPGERLGVAEIASVETVPYDPPHTYDILPASDTGTYFVGGAWIGSTLHEHGVAGTDGLCARDGATRDVTTSK